MQRRIAMIQDIAPHKLNNQYDPLAVPEREDFVLFFDGGRLLMKVGANKELLRVKDFPENCEFAYLFSLDDNRFFLLSEENTIPEGCEFMDVRTLRGASWLPREILYAIFTGKHLSDWYRDTHFCGRCGRAMTHSTNERAMKCTCGYTAYKDLNHLSSAEIKTLMQRYYDGEAVTKLAKEYQLSVRTSELYKLFPPEVCEVM